MPRDLPHTFHPIGAAVSALLVITPGGLDEYFAQLHAALEQHADPARLSEIAAAYGITML